VTALEVAVPLAALAGAAAGALALHVSTRRLTVPPRWSPEMDDPAGLSMRPAAVVIWLTFRELDRAPPDVADRLRPLIHDLADRAREEERLAGPPHSN